MAVTDVLALFWQERQTPEHCDPGVGIMSRVSHGAVIPQENLGHQIGGLFLSSSGLIRCNSIRDTVQTQHKHIPRQRNGHHPRDSEP
jgi:hypothetical protein